MTFSGTNTTIKRNFFTQTGELGFSISCLVDNTTGLYQFGISGSAGNSLNFTLQSGRLYYEDCFIHTYQSDEGFVINAQFTTGSANVIKDSAPLVYGKPKGTGYFDYFYMTRASTDMGAIFDIQVSGNNFPSYTISNQGYLLTSGQNAVTGYYLNRSAFPIKVFDSSIQATANYDFGKLASEIPEAGTGYFAYTGDYDLIDFSQPILTTFNANYGNTDVQFYITDARSFNRFVFLTSPTDFSFNSDNTIQRIVSWQNYSGGFVTNAFGTSLNFALEYVTGSGVFSDSSFATNVPYTGIAYGAFSRSGTLTGLTQFATGNSSSTGVYSISFSQFAWATGRSTGFFSGLGTGLGSGLGYSGLAYSAFTGSATGFIHNGSGTLLIGGSVTGYPVGPAYSLNYTSYTNATGFVNISGMSLGDSFYINSSASPIVKGVQFINETGLVYYLSGASQHQVNGIYNGGYITLTATPIGIIGNGIAIWENQCEQGGGLFSFSPFLTGGTNNGATGVALVPIGAFTGAPGFIITGSGNYQSLVSGVANGEFLYTRTFTGAWDFYTGIDGDSLISLKTPGSYDSNMISGSGYFAPNSQFIMRVINNSNGINMDGARLIISGAEVLNPINQVLYTPNV